MMMKAETTRAQTIRFIFDRFLKDEKDLEKKRNWASESRAAQFLVNTYGEEIWPYVNLGFRLNSLNWLRTNDGKKKIMEGVAKHKSVQTPQKVVDKNDVLVYSRVTSSQKSFRERLIE